METKQLSLQARALWGKLSLDGTNCWLPLWVHLADTAEVAVMLWQKWLPSHTKGIIVQGIKSIQQEPAQLNEEYVVRLVKFLAAAHDCGKADKFFVEKAIQAGFSDVVDEITSKGLPVIIRNRVLAKACPHALVGERILEMHGLDRSMADIIGGHHGKPPNTEEEFSIVEEYADLMGKKEPAWRNVQDELVVFALSLADLEHIPKEKLSVPAQVLLSGILIMADWLASDETRFPWISRDIGTQELLSAQERTRRAWSHLGLSEAGWFSSDCPWENLYQERFGRNPRPVQQHSLQTALAMKTPGMMIIEAPMGEGKTEAALGVAEVLAKKFGLGGVYFALPTQATSDGIFPRIAKWIERLKPENKKSIFLAHGKSGFNEDYIGIKLQSHLFGEEDNAYLSVVVNDWTQGRKKGLLADFVVGTIDQVLMGGLKAKHLALRHLGLANKVIILDECHAYDAYMNQYLDLVLKWLGAYQVPVIVLSATLPQERRKSLLEAYQAGAIRKKKKKKSFFVRNQPKELLEEAANPVYENQSYPLISYTDGDETKVDVPEASGRKNTITIKYIDFELLTDKLGELLVDGGCVGIICNTVKRAQETAQLLEMYFGEEYVRLLHSRFISVDRVRKEQEIRELLGPGEGNRPTKLIVVGTQVMEQSLDVDFDVLFTDICPMDLLLQRIGRLHRHKRENKRLGCMQEACCYVMGIISPLEFEQGAEVVYGKYLLLKTNAVLPEKIIIPDDIPMLVQCVYTSGNQEMILQQIGRMSESAENASLVYGNAEKEYQRLIETKRTKALTYQIKTPQTQSEDGNLVGWLNTTIKDDSSGKRGEATVRDSGDSLEVLVVYQKDDGNIYTLPWLPEYGDERIDDVSDDGFAKAIAGCMVSLPAYFVSDWNIDKTIEELEQIVLSKGMDSWYVSHWLKGELFLVLNEDYEMDLLDKKIVYDEKYGLWMYEEV